MSCHESGDSQAMLPGKTYQDFRPGTPLAETMTVLMIPPREADTSEHLQHYAQMSMSMCYRKTSGQLRCATCHDPHVLPSDDDAPDYFNSKCLGCHNRSACKAPAAARQETRPSDSCIACHMPRRDMTDTPHTSLTSHQILARSGEPIPEGAFQRTAALPDLIYIDRSLDGDPDPPALSLLEGYRLIAERHPEYRNAYLKKLAELESSDPQNAVVQFDLGARSLEAAEPRAAAEHLERAIHLDPGNAAAYAYLAEALAQQGRTDEALDAAEKAAALDPFKPLYQKTLIDRLIAAKQYDRALAAIKHYMDVFPEDDLMRKMLKIAEQ
jgi:hypothetical protein